MQAPSRLLHSQRSAIAFTQTELLVVAVVLGLLIALLLPWLAKKDAKRKWIKCANNLKQVGLAQKIGTGDSDRFFCQISTNHGGLAELVGTGQIFRNYFALSNELATLTILSCPADAFRKPATAWSSMNNTNLSYFVGVDAYETHPNLLLGGDRNIEARLPRTGSALWLATNNPVWWGKDIHGWVGNVVLADGSVQHMDTARLWAQVQVGLETKPLTNRLDFP